MHEILIERFLTTWWVQSILHENNKDNDDPESAHHYQQPPAPPAAGGLAEIEEINKSLKSGNILPVKVFLFLKWLVDELSSCDQKTKIVLMISSHMHLDYVHAAKVEIRKIMQSDSYKTDLKRKFLKLETFTEEFWPVRWFINIRWTWKEVPSKIWYLPQIKFLNFTKDNKYENKFESISHLVGKLNTVELLCLRSNFLSVLPETLVFCQELKELQLENNELEELPLFLKDMPKLETIYRYHNPCSTPMNCSKSVTVDKHKTRGGEDDDEELEFEIEEDEIKEEEMAKKNTSPLSLLELSSKSICKQVFRNPSEIDQLNIPRQLKEIIYYSCGSLNFCYNCKKGLHPAYESNKCKTTLPVFLGLTLVPVYCYSCDECLDDICDTLKSLSSKHKTNNDDDITMFINDEVSSTELHRQNCPDCRGSKLRKIVNGLMCHRGHR